jgi:hypothetical protein
MNYKTNTSVDENIFEIGLSSTMNSLAQQSSTKFLKAIRLNQNYLFLFYLNFYKNVFLAYY